MNDPRIELLIGDCRETLLAIPAGSVACCVTSPPYFGLRDYGVDGQIGLEPTPAAFVEQLVKVFREVRRVLRDDGTLWVNLGDSYAGSGRGGYAGGSSTLQGTVEGQDNSRIARRQQRLSAGLHETQVANGAIGRTWVAPPPGLKRKELIGIPWRVAFALQADGWYLRQDIIWAKPNPIPESIRDRCTKAHEYLFLLSKSERYYFDADAIREPATSAWNPDDCKMPDGWDTGDGGHGAFHRNGRQKGASGNKARKPAAERGIPNAPAGTTSGHVAGSVPWEGETRNKRSVWTVATCPYPGSHFATFPPALIEPCILAGSREGDKVLDPFGGSGTTPGVALKHGRRAIMCELNPAYAAMVDARVRSIAEQEFGLFDVPEAAPEPPAKSPDLFHGAAT